MYEVHLWLIPIFTLFTKVPWLNIEEPIRTNRYKTFCFYCCEVILGAIPQKYNTSALKEVHKSCFLYNTCVVLMHVVCTHAVYGMKSTTKIIGLFHVQCTFLRSCTVHSARAYKNIFIYINIIKVCAYEAWTLT